MKTVSKFAAFALLLFAVAYCSAAEKGSAAPPSNLVRGAVGPFSLNSSWSNYSVVTLIPGASLIPVTSTQTVLYLGFAAGSEADITNMVLYTTAKGSLTITAVTPVTLGGISNPQIMLSATSVCPNQPLSVTSVCVVRLDPTSIVLSADNDYYFVVYFTNDGNNGSIGSPQAEFSFSALNSWYASNENYTTFTVGQSLPSNQSFHGTPYFLIYVMND